MKEITTIIYSLIFTLGGTILTSMYSVSCYDSPSNVFFFTSGLLLIISGVLTGFTSIKICNK
ncbi:hypothetical protein [Clostridium oceanicum]|uniref:Uncharacterized protein n=1 Tax=Clostridium oceanicum TaxID=1543 RepID=A0ABP3UEP1_9CLOT